MTKEKLLKTLSTQLTQRRAQLGKNQDCVEDFGLSLKYYQKLESPKLLKNPSLWVLYCLARAFKISITISPTGLKLHG